MSASLTKTSKAKLNQVKDMTSGSPIKLIVAYALPLLFGNVCQQLYNVVDTAVVGRALGVNALAAVGSTGSLNWMILGFVMGLCNGFSIKIAQCFGAGDNEKMRKVAVNSIYLAIIISAIISIIFPFIVRNLLRLTRTPAEILDDATLYLSIILAGSIVFVLYNISSAILRAVGNTKTPFIVIIIGSVINIILDVLFVIVFAWGIAGAAIATLMSSFVCGGICLFAVCRIPVLKPNREEMRWDGMLAKDLVKLGLPVGLMNAVTAVGTVILQGAVNMMGAVIVAAFALGAKIIGMLFQILEVMGVAVGTFTGQNYGAGKFDRVKKGTRQALGLQMVFSVVIMLIVGFAGKFLSAAFIGAENTEVINESYKYMMASTMFVPALGVLFLYRNTLTGLGNTIIPMCTGILELFMRPLALVVLPMSWGIFRASGAEIFAWVGAGLMNFIGYYIMEKKKK